MDGFAMEFDYLNLLFEKLKKSQLFVKFYERVFSHRGSGKKNPMLL